MSALDVPPHGLVALTVHGLGGGVFTVTETFWTVAISAAEIDAVNPFADTNVVVRELPFH